MIEPASALTEVMFALAGLLVVVFFYGLRSREERQALLFLAMAAYALKAALVPAYHWLLVQAGREGFAYADSLGYHVSATGMALELAKGLPREDLGWSFKDPGYSVICAILYAIFGSSTIIARLFNSVVATFTLLYVYRIGRLGFDARVGKIAARFAAFLPYSILVTINHRKEPVVIFVATLLFYHAYRVVLQDRNWLNSVPLILLWLVPMYYLRSGFVLPFLAFFLMMLLFAQRSLLVGGILSFFVVIGLFAAQFLFPESSGIDVQQSLAGLDERLQHAAHEVQHSSGLLRYVKATSLLDIWKVPFAAFLLVLMPFPPNFWGLELIHVTLLDWSHLAFIVFLPQFFTGTLLIFRRDAWRRRLPLFIYSAGFLSVIGALSVGVMRYRETVFPVVLVITAAGLRQRQNFVWIASVYAGLVVFALFVYFNRFAI